MGLKDRNTQGVYLKLKNGLFFKKDEEKGWPELSGVITNMRYKDEEYEGAPQRKFYLSIFAEDDQTTYMIGLNTESANYSSLVSYLKGVDIKAAVTLHPKSETSTKDGKEITRNSILVSQYSDKEKKEIYAKGYFTKDNNHGAPEWEKVKVGNKIITDKSAYTDFLEKFVNENFISKLNSGSAVIHESPKVDVAPKAKKEAKVTVEQPQEDDLPW